MLQALNDRIKGWLGAFVIALITIPFALWGIQTYVGGSADKFAARVNGDEISQFELERAYSNQLARLKQQFGDQLPFSNEQIKAQVLEQIINSRVLDSASYQNRYRISDNMLSENIRRLFSREGTFDRDLLNATIASQGLTISQFEGSLRSDMRVMQKRNAILQTAFTTNAEAQALAALEDQQRDISIIRFALEAHSGDVNVTDEDISAWYEDNPDRYMNPDRVSVDYVELKGADLKADIDVDEELLRSLYETYRESVLRNEERKASHILLQTDSADEGGREAAMARMDDIRQKLEGGADFAALAKEFSDDPGSARQGGDLGWIRAGDMVKPFEDALFAMQKGAVSDVVETQFGLHLIRLEDVRTPEIQTFEQKRAEFEQQQRDEAVSEMFYDLSEALATAAYENPDSLGPAREAIGAELQHSAVFTRESGEGIAANSEFRKAAFRQSVIEGMNSDIVELDRDHVVVMRVREHFPATRRPLEEVRDSIASVLKLREAHNRTLAAALEAKKALEDGAGIDSVLGKGQIVENPGPIQRTETIKVDPGIARAAFQMPYPSDGAITVKDVKMLSGDVALVILNRVITPDIVSADKAARTRQERTVDVAQSEFGYALATLRAGTEIEKADNAAR